MIEYHWSKRPWNYQASGSHSLFVSEHTWNQNIMCASGSLRYRNLNTHMESKINKSLCIMLRSLLNIILRRGTRTYTIGKNYKFSNISAIATKKHQNLSFSINIKLRHGRQVLPTKTVIIYHVFFNPCAQSIEEQFEASY